MKHAIILLTVIPVRAEAADPSEIVTQLLFGETVEIIQRVEKTNWVKIRCTKDTYEGWVDPKQLTMISESAFNEVNKSSVYIGEGQALVSGRKVELLLGSRIPLEGQIAKELECDAEILNYHQSDQILVAQAYLGAPYLWGGRSAVGIDCSGFTQQVFGICGIALFRDASLQVSQGVNVAFKDLEPGDLMFFQNKGGRIIHVGILLNDQEIMHAHGQVKVSEYDDQGIWDDDQINYTHTYHCVRRV